MEEGLELVQVEISNERYNRQVIVLINALLTIDGILFADKNANDQKREAA